MLDHIAIDIPPVVENLRAQNMSTNTPDGRISLCGKPLVAQLLSIVVMDFKRAVVDMRRGVCAQEERVVIDQVLATINMRKDRHILLDAFLLHIEEIGGDDVKVVRIEIELRGEVLNAKSVVSKLQKLVCRITEFYFYAIVHIPCKPQQGPGST